VHTCAAEDDAFWELPANRPQSARYVREHVIVFLIAAWRPLHPHVAMSPGAGIDNPSERRCCPAPLSNRLRRHSDPAGLHYVQAARAPNRSMNFVKYVPVVS
jgi:hypothetical protein